MIGTYFFVAAVFIILAADLLFGTWVMATGIRLRDMAATLHGLLLISNLIFIIFCIKQITHDVEKTDAVTYHFCKQIKTEHFGAGTKYHINEIGEDVAVCGRFVILSINEYSVRRDEVCKSCIRWCNDRVIALTQIRFRMRI